MGFLKYFSLVVVFFNNLSNGNPSIEVEIIPVTGSLFLQNCGLRRGIMIYPEPCATAPISFHFYGHFTRPNPTNTTSNLQYYALLYVLTDRLNYEFQFQ